MLKDVWLIDVGLGGAVRDIQVMSTVVCNIQWKHTGMNSMS